MDFKERNNVKTYNINEVEDMGRKFGLSPDFCSILFKKGLDNEQKIQEYLNPSFNNVFDPFLFRNMGYVVNRIKKAIQNKEGICIFGDYDVDGTLATASLLLTLKWLGAKVSYYIPNRHTDGYGLNKDAIKAMTGISLIITVDCGITSIEEVEYAKSLGIDVIVTDHHNPKDVLPNCAIIDAKVPGETYPFKELCGTGVVAKIIHALCGIEYMKKFIDLIAIATVADLVPLVSENRIFVQKGLDFMNYMKRPGIQGLSKYAQGEEKVQSYHLGFRYGPMINACGRLGDATDVVKLMTTADPTTIETLSKKLYDYNEKRKEIEKNILEECLKKIGQASKKSIVLWGENWETGVIGIVASRLVEIYHCPVILLGYDSSKGLYVGSGRSIDGISLFNLLSNCSDVIFSFGGHDAAAGLKISPENLQIFSQKFDDECKKFSDDIFKEIVIYDLPIKINTITKKFFGELQRVQPTGLGNPNVKFLLKNVSIKNVIARGKNREHFSCTIFDETANCNAICFNNKIPESLDNIDMVISLTINNYKGKEEINCIIEKFKIDENISCINLASPVTQYGVRVIDSPLEILGISDKKIAQFNKSGIFSVQQLVNYLPKKYLDFRYPKKANEIYSQAELCSMIGTVIKLKQGPKISYAMCKDENNNLFMAAWFHQDYVLRLINVGYQYIFCGKAQRSESGLVQIYPMYFSYDINKYKTIIPEYKKIKGMSNEYLLESIDKALQLTANTDFLDKFIVDKFHLMSDYDATRVLHHPKNDFEIRDGQRRKVFNDLFKFNFILKSKNNDKAQSQFVMKKREKWNELKNILPYKLTGDQNKCLEELYQYMSSGKVLNALVQGDVGSGKTMIGLFSMLLAANNGYQSCIIAPTEVLAKQHYEEISNYMDKLGYKVGYLVGGLKTRERKAVLAGLKDGTINMVVGTHAIIQDSVEFNNLSLVVIDEQHRFGVSQREKLSNMLGPHMISMSATPIPRTLSMALYGDNIQVYSIKEKPAGRKDIITKQMENDDEINMFMLEQIRQGRQCYVVCPLIEDSESEAMSDVRSVKQEVDSLFNFFKNYPEVKISNTTGKMKKELIEEEIQKFVNNETNILVSTTIIEVGVNVPNSTVMVLKSSERFGLAQSHQLRGRVGRGNYQSYCILQTTKDDPKAEILCNTNDGFEIAKQDLLLRGAGDYIGTQQTGNNRNVLLMMSEPELYKKISSLNDEIFNDNKLFSKYKYILEENEQKEE